MNFLALLVTEIFDLNGKLQNGIILFSFIVETSYVLAQKDDIFWNVPDSITQQLLKLRW